MVHGWFLFAAGDLSTRATELIAGGVRVLANETHSTERMSQSRFHAGARQC
jgi:hypothetical protein